MITVLVKGHDVPMLMGAKNGEGVSFWPGTVLLLFFLFFFFFRAGGGVFFRKRCFLTLKFIH